MKLKKHLMVAHGFSLLELSIVLVIIALISGFGISMSSNILTSADRVTTRERLLVIQQALEAYVAKNGYLPCPASRLLTPTDVDFGKEKRIEKGGLASIEITELMNQGWRNYTESVTVSGGNPTQNAQVTAVLAKNPYGNNGVISFKITDPGKGYTSPPNISVGYTTGDEDSYTFTAKLTSVCDDTNGVTSVTNSYTGAVPTQTLGIPASYAADAWKNKFLYAVSPKLVTGGTGAMAREDGTIRISYGTLSGSYIITDKASYIVLSHGRDGKGAYPLLSTASIPAVPCGSSSNIDTQNCDGGFNFYDAEYNDGSQADYFFDDYVLWGSNGLKKMPSTNTTAGIGSDCASGVCEAWCARCLNAPAYTAPVTNGTFSSYVCQSNVVSNSPCQANCIYAYFDKNGNNSSGKPLNIPCP